MRPPGPTPAEFSSPGERFGGRCAGMSGQVLIGAQWKSSPGQGVNSRTVSTYSRARDNVTPDAAVREWSREVPWTMPFSTCPRCDR
ncbi:hypothetical protein SHL15_8204 [Streptomyces hygroscopicus subsp. limoneus]|nr:hypothetical protein SHL15_8204 [Streptomyces hygroscopicus subsp. limoneus]